MDTRRSKDSGDYAHTHIQVIMHTHTHTDIDRTQTHTQVVDDGIAERGELARRIVVFSRVFDSWKRFAVEKQQLRACAEAVSGFGLIRVLMDWRRKTKVRVCV